MNRPTWKAFAWALIACITTPSALAESKIVTGTATTSGAAAKLNLKIVIPEFIALKVGSGAILTNNTAVDEITLAVPEADASNDTTIASSPVAVQLVSNVGSVSFSSSGDALTSDTETIALSRISVNSSNSALPHPGFGATATPLAPSAGTKVINASTNWIFNYHHQGSTAPVGAGTFTTQITYTVAKP
ncbi:hypothetical protein [Hydrogenophaga sp.]|uniref:hypothetical protein n=1 Tax=Hydrogenophaga sp. TaxID=1904254 RepID=UPI0035B0DE14